MVKRALLVALVTASTVIASAAESIPQGTTLHCQLTETLSTRVSLQGDRFTATVTEPIALNGRDGATLSRVRVPVARPLKKRWVSRPEGPGGTGFRLPGGRHGCRRRSALCGPHAQTRAGPDSGQRHSAQLPVDARLGNPVDRLC